jgi:hypothetical protein
MELALPSLSAAREPGPELLFRLLELRVPCEDRERNRLLRFSSFCWTDTADASFPMLCSGSADDSLGGNDAVGEDIGEDTGIGSGRLAFKRVLEMRFVLFKKPLGFNRPAVA